MKKTLLIVPLVCVLMAADKKEDDAKAELKKLAGTWTVTKEVKDGKELPAEDAKKMKVIFDGDGKWKLERDGQTIFTGTMTVDTTMKPKTIDYTITEGDAKGTKVSAIYELDGDTFKHCWAVDADRPKEFAAKAGSGFTFSTFKRDKK